LAVLFGWAFRQRKAVYAVDEAATGVDVTAIWLGAHAGLTAALAVGVVDHYFFEMSFQSAGTLFWLFIGLCLATTRLATRAAERHAPYTAQPIVSPAAPRSAGTPAPR
jgi:hypothetical protein